MKKRTKAQNDKMVATRRALKAAKLAKQAEAVDEMLIRDSKAITYLMQAEHIMTKPFSEAELYSLLALKVLTTKERGK